MLEHKKDIHSLRYRVTDRRGYSVWVHCRGIIRWSEDRTTPLFFSGCVSRLESNFAMDATTGFLRERAALNELVTLSSRNTPALVIDLSKPFERITMVDAVKKYAGVDFDQIKTLEEARAIAKEKGVEFEPRHKKGDILSLFFEEFAEEHLINLSYYTFH